MRKWKSVGLVVVTLGVLGVGFYFFFETSTLTRKLPNLTKRSGETSPSSEFLNAQRAVEFYRNEIRDHPDVVKNYGELAQLYLQEARVTGKESDYIPRARYLLEEALERDPNDFNALLIKASMLLTMHQFHDAKQLVEKVIASNPHNAFAYGVLCDANVEIGEYADAVKACEKMLSIRPDLRSYSRASYLRELYGDYKGAREAMRLACDAGVHGQENRAWALYYLGKLYLEEGMLDTAEYVFKGILEERPNYSFALSGLAQINAARGDYDEAIILLQTAYELTPEHTFLEQEANICKATGQLQKANTLVQEVLKAFEQDEKNGSNINREYAMFCAEQGINLPQALQRAEAEYKRRPKNIDVLDTYAWTMYKNGRSLEAIPFIEQAVRLSTRNSSLSLRAAMIYSAAGLREKAHQYVQRSLQQKGYVNAILSKSARELMSYIGALTTQ
jgi:tetratricopeptide (TPR) repeat protein